MARTTMILATATREAADPVAVAAGLHYANRASMVPCGGCGLPIHRDRSRTPSGAVRSGAPIVNGAPVCRVCDPIVSAGDAAALRPRFLARVATWNRVQSIWVAREAAESAK